MKLIHKTTLYYLLISLPLFVLAGFASYFLILKELRQGADEALQKEKANAIEAISHFSEPRNVNLSFDGLSTIRIIDEKKQAKSIPIQKFTIRRKTNTYPTEY